MEAQQVIEHAKRIHQSIQRYAKTDESGAEGAKAQVCEFLRQYAGLNSSFTKEAEKINGAGWANNVITALSNILDSLIQYLEGGLSTGLSAERRAQIDVVSDFLGQAQFMLEETKIHPAAPTTLIGASLEEFLRNWVEAEQLSIGNAQPGIDAYAKALRTQEFISKQDIKDITAWAGIRNYAAHGEWDQVADASRVRLMLESVNLFIRQKTG